MHCEAGLFPGRDGALGGADRVGQHFSPLAHNATSVVESQLWSVGGKRAVGLPGERERDLSGVPDREAACTGGEVGGGRGERISKRVKQVVCMYSTYMYCKSEKLGCNLA